ncbi:MAG TPA: helix-hairpin-helix domain-containing protein, partial [Cyclobacteriaceae bacterium]|nr:helix-hairpin-helix domain-containing protein [Cyclobacteriaceae bacterium]
MSRLRAWIRSFFGFSRTETNAFLILLPGMIILVFSEPAYRYWFVRQPQDFSREKRELDSLIATWKWDEPDSTIAATTRPQLFSFDPNQADRDEMMALGFTRPLSNRIVNYRNKGGKFAVKKDLMKIYGMDSLLYRRIFAYIDLPERITRERVAAKSDATTKLTLTKFDLNRADTTQLIAVYGIGPKLALRITAYRKKLGGFISGDQLREVYGLDTAVVRELFRKSFIEENFIPRLIDINRATEQ